MDSASSLLCCRNTTRARRHGKQHIYLLYLFTRLSACSFQTLFLTPGPPGNGIFGDDACVCLLVCARIMSSLRDRKQDQQRWIKKTFTVYNGIAGLKQGHCKRRAMQPFRHITGEDKGECLSHCNLITFSFMNEKIKTPQHFHPALSINI